jgi:hypothetical protein
MDTFDSTVESLETNERRRCARFGLRNLGEFPRGEIQDLLILKSHSMSQFAIYLMVP